MEINPSKCACTTNKPRFRYRSLSYNNTPIPILESTESYKYLGVPINLNLEWENLLNQMKVKYCKHLDSTCKKFYIGSTFIIRLINMVLLPKLAYPLQFFIATAKFHKSIAQITINKLNSLIHITKTSSPEYWYIHRNLMHITHINFSSYISSTLDRGLNSENDLVSNIVSFGQTQNKLNTFLPPLNLLLKKKNLDFTIEPTSPQLEVPSSSQISLEVWTDASLILGDDPNSKCAIIDANENSCTFTPSGAASTINVELQAIAKALQLYFYSPTLTIYTDSLSSILAIKNLHKYKNSLIKKFLHQPSLITASKLS